MEVMLFNIQSNENGGFQYGYNDPKITLFTEIDFPHSILGRSVVIHANPDDMGMGGNAESLKTGNAGARVAGAVIGISKS